MKRPADSDNEIERRFSLINEAEEAVNNNKKVIFLLENPRDVDIAIYLNKLQSPNLRIIVSSPAAAWELEKRGIPHTYLNQFFDFSYEHKIGYENFLTLNKICEKIDHVFISHNPVIARYQFRLSHNFFPFLKILFDGIVFRIDVLKEIIRQEKPDVIIVVKNPESFFTDHGEPLGYPFTRDESIYAIILHLEGWPCKSIHMERKTDTKNAGNSALISVKKAILNSILIRNISLYSIGRMEKKIGVRNTLTLFPAIFMNWVNRGRVLIFTSYSVEWQTHIPSFLTKGYRVLFINESDKMRVPKEKTNPIPLENLGLEHYCLRQGTDFSPVFLKKIAPLLNRVASDFTQYHQNAESLIAKYHPVACIGNVDAYLGKFFVIIAKQHAIPKMTWQHGTTGYINTPIFIYEELINSDYYLVWGKGVSEMYSRLSRQFPFEIPGKIIPAGSTNLETIFNTQTLPAANRQTEIRVLYGTMSYYHNALNFGFDHKFDDIRMWQVQKEIIEFLSQCPCTVTLKLHPGEKEDYHIREFIKMKNLKNIRIIKTENSFSELALQSDIIILDCPSTILLEAVAAKKTVFALLEFLPIVDDAKKLLEKRAYISHTCAELKDQIEKYLNNEPMNQNPRTENLEFLECFGIPQTDNSSVLKNVTEFLDPLSE